MRSLVRRRIELVARVGGLLALGALVFITPAWRGRVTRSADDAGLAPALIAASRQPTEQLQLNLAAPPDPVQRSWLAALRGAGTRVTWRIADATLVPPTALIAERLPGPPAASRALIQVITTPGAKVVIADDYATLDSTVASATGVVTWVGPAPAAGSVTMRTANSRAAAYADTVPDSRAILVLARAGWEGKFVVAALEESGWLVESEFLVAPAGSTPPLQGPPTASPPLTGRSVFVRTRGAGVPIDTSRFSAVVALDATSARRSASIIAFVRSGGGLVLGPDAMIPAFRSIAPAVPATRRPAAIGDPDPHPDSARSRLSLRTLRVSQGAVPLEVAGTSVAVAAGREQLGRVVAAGYEESWRWRLLGSDESASGHREWWSSLVAAAAARRPAQPPRPNLVYDPLPFAAAIQALGPPSAPAGDAPLIPWRHILFLTAMLLLLAEWTSRRMRGAR
ncbi:MAG: hypothetical protein ACT4OZ_11850 [Gemmatimonadota bacterium]